MDIPVRREVLVAALCRQFAHYEKLSQETTGNIRTAVNQYMAECKMMIMELQAADNKSIGNAFNEINKNA